MSEEKFCYFCDKSVGSIEFPQTRLICQNHPHHVYQWYGGSHGVEIPFDVHFDIKIKDKIFKVRVYPKTPRTEIHEKRKKLLALPPPSVVSPDAPIGPYYIDENIEVFSTQALIGITPENAEKKLPTIITFS